MRNVHLQYNILPSEDGGVVTHAQAYIKAEDHHEAEDKLAKYLGKKVKYEVTQFADANAEVIA